MSRKSIIISLTVLAVMFIGIGVAVLYLYSGMDMPSRPEKSHVADNDRHMLLSAVPSDAVLAACFSDARTAAPEMIEGLVMPEGMKKSAMAVSLHYSGKLLPLYVFEAPSDEAAADAFADALSASGLKVDRSEGGFVIASESETILKSSVRHIGKKVSVLDASGFGKVLSGLSGGNFVAVSNAQISRLLPAVMSRTYSKYTDFLMRVSEWTAFDISSTADGLSLKGTAVYDGDATDFMTVLQKSAPSASSVSSVLPSYTLFAFTLPMRDPDAYIAAYQSYLDTRQKLQANLANRQKLTKDYGVTPQDIMTRLDVREVATASLMLGGKMEKALLMKVGNKDVESLDSISYSAVASSLFGSLFSTDAGAESLLVGGWIVTGSKTLVDEYRTGKALEYTLKDYLADAGQTELSPVKNTALLSYFSFTEDPSALDKIFASDFLKGLEETIGEADVVPAVFTVSHGKNGVELNLALRRLTLSKSNENMFERDTVVVIPKGPFKVKNSGTGKMNEFYQNSHLSLCLREEGKDLWGVSFDKPLCGTAGTVDYFANGKLQILFGAGSHIYLIDRLGRYVNGFPVDLKKDILLGPDIYDFSGNRKYNIMVLHKDNTIDMYNLKGVKPSSWKGIAVPEGKIKSLPERMDLSGSTFWVVRTSVQTLIYPFYGGEPLTVYEGAQRIRPDSEIKAVDGKTVEFTCYDGKVRTQTLK